MGDEWQHHQDGRDHAVELGTRLLLAMLAGSVLFGVGSVVIGGLNPLEGAGAGLLMLVSCFCIACII